MKLKVTKDLCEIKENEVWNVGDYNVHTVQVELSPEFNGLVNKVRYFVEDNSYDMLITDNVAQVPHEATVMEGTIKIGVYGYNADTNILVQSTSPVNKYISSGTYTGEADNTEPLTPTDKEQMQTAIQKNTNDITDLKENKQDKLISGVNIKTINNESILSSGNLTLVEEEADPIFTNSPAYSITDNDITYWNNKANMSDIPDVSNFITKDVDNLTYYTKSIDMQTAINNAVGNERTARENADNSLQNQIDAITVSSDVVDVVSTYQDLVDYDTQHIKANDIIKVMQDSTHDNAISYYRWVIVNHVGSWEYVGSEGPYYTKSETDTLLNAKQNTLVSGQNIKTINNESLLGEGNINIQSGGASDYADLSNKPKINNVELNGNKTLNDLGIQPVGNYALESDMTEAQNDIDHLSKISNLFEKITGTGTSVTLNDTSNTIMKLSLDTTTSSQEGTPSPSDPQEIHTITGNNVITISNSDNTKSQTYPINLGDIELCKIGDYKDVLFKNTINSPYYNVNLQLNKWYKYNNIEKKLFKGGNDEEWRLLSNTNKFYINLNRALIILNKMYSNYYLYNSTGQASLNNGEFTNIGGAGTYLWFRNDDISSANDFKTWLTTHNTSVYLPLTTPTYTLLNDTLQTQLDNLQYALAYDTQTNISQTNNDLPFIINAETYKEINLTDYVKNTNYATKTVGGVVKVDNYYDISLDSGGALRSNTVSYNDYLTENNNMFISKGTLENVLKGYGLIE